MRLTRPGAGAILVVVVDVDGEEPADVGTDEPQPPPGLLGPRRPGVERKVVGGEVAVLVDEIEALYRAFLAHEDDLVALPPPRAHDVGLVDVGAASAEQVAVPEQDLHRPAR